MTKEVIFSKIDNLLKQNNLIVCISGRSCSGKTTLANDIKNKFFYAQPLILCQDSWYKNLSDFKRDNKGYFDLECEDAFEIEEFKKDIDYLMATKHCFVPYYSVEKNQRLAKGTDVIFSSLIILEGLHTIDIFKNLDKDYSVLYVFVDTPLSICIKRRVDRDYKLFDVNPVMVADRYRNVIDVHYNPYYNSQKKIVLNKSERGVVLDD